MKSFLMIGMGKFGHHLCRKLSALGNDIMIADEKEENIADLLDLVTSAKIGDCTRREVLETFGVEEFDACIVCISEDFQSSLQVTDLLHDMGAKQVISLACTDIQAKFLLRSGADRVVYPDRDIAERVSVWISNDSIFDYIALSDEYSIYEITPPDRWIGRSIKDVQVRVKYHVSILAVKKDGKIKAMPSAEYVFREDEHLMVMGGREDIQRLVR